jgi:WD40 repeat protein
VEAYADTDNALAGFYADQVTAVAASTGVSERRIRDWFEHSLITDQGFRAQSFEFPHEHGPEVLKALEDAYLIRADSRRGVNWYELTHDRMIAPVLENNAEWRESRLNPLQLRAAEWEANGRPAGLLVTGEVLAEAITWVASSPDATPVERDFVSDSRVAEDEVKAELARHEAEARKARHRSFLFGALALLAVAGLIVSAFFYVSANNSKKRAQRSESRAADAASAAKTAQQQAESSQHESEARDLAARSLAAGDPYEATLLAIEAESRTDEPSLQPRLAWVDAVARLSRLPAVQDGAAMDIGGEPSTAAFSKDGRQLAIGDFDGTVAFYDTTKRARVGTPLVVGSTVQQVEWSADGRSVAILTDDGVVRRYSASRHEQLGEPSAPHDGAFLAAVDPTGSRLALAEGDTYTITIYDTSTNKAIAPGIVLPAGAGPSAMTWSPNGSMLAIGDDVGGVTLLDRRGGAGRTLVAQQNDQTSVDHSVATLSWDPSGTAVAVGDEWGVRTYALPGSTGRSIAPSRVASPSAVEWSPDGRLIAVATDSGSVQLMDVLNFGLLSDAFTSADNDVSLLAWSPSGADLAVVSATGAAAFFKLNAQATAADVIGGGRGASDVAWDPTGSTIAISTQGGVVQRYDARTGRPIGAPINSLAGDQPTSPLFFPAIVWNPDGTQLATTREDGTWQVIDSVSGARTAVLGDAPPPPPADEPVIADVEHQGLAWSPDGRSIAVGGYFSADDAASDIDNADVGNDSIQVLDARTLRPRGDPISNADLDATNLAWSPDGSKLAAGGPYGTIELLEVSTGEQVGDEINVSDSGLIGLAWSPDGKSIAAADDRKLYLFDAESHAPLADAVLVDPQPDRTTSAIAWSPRGNVIAAVDTLGTVRYFDAATLASVGPDMVSPQYAAGSTALSFFKGAEPAISWNKDGTELAVTDAGMSARLLHSWSESEACELLKSIIPAERMDGLIGIPDATSQCARGEVVSSAPVPVLSQLLD